ncbi:MAG TPA: NAD-dependent protein deacetylase of SIR2 family [Myxococcales bacterium]
MPSAAAHKTGLPAVAPLSPLVAERVAALLQAADHVLIGAGAGMSVDAGFDYTSEAQFVRRYPVLSKQGPRCRYHLFGYPWPSPAVQWGHIARHLEELRFGPPPDPVPYEQLRALTETKDRFVVTSNADDLFERLGFSAERLWTRQGSYSRLQCLAPCSPESTWPAGPFVEAAVPKVDLATEELTDPALVPRCPRCGGEAMLNVRGGDWFLETPYQPQGQRFEAWLKKAFAGRLLILDVGTGFNTPSVVRWLVEEIALAHSDADLVRVNAFHPEVPRELGRRGLGIATAGAPLWAALTSLARESAPPRT